MVAVDVAVRVKVAGTKGTRVFVGVGVWVSVGVTGVTSVDVIVGEVVTVGVSVYVAETSEVLVMTGLGVAVGPGGRLEKRTAPNPRQ